VNSVSLFSQVLDPHRRAYILGVMTACVMVVGVFAQDLIAYLCVAIPALVPLFLWMRAGALGMPVLPAISGLFFVYYAVPLLRSDIALYGSEELIGAAAMVGSFLVAASVASLPFLQRARQQASMASRNVVSDNQIVRMVYVGLAGGILYHLALISGGLSWLGTSVGLVRSVVLTLTSIACYLLGCARASGLLVGDRWVLAVAGLSVLILLALSNLLLVGGAMNGLAAVLGYVITAKRIPWIGLGFAFAILSVLHAGKLEMRRTYWMPQTQSVQQSSVFQIPGMMADWFTAGIVALGSGGQESSVLERASLLHMLLLVQRATPGFIPHLGGQTYAMLPQILVPRFINPDKPESQAVLNFLSIRYGLQYVESTTSTTIGWGLVAEAYANFGYLAAIPVGLLFGALCGALMRLSARASPLSLPMFVTIASTLVLFNLELDLSYLIVTLAQTIAAVLLLASLPELLKRRMTRVPKPTSFNPNEPPFGEMPSRWRSPGP
jgi:hypothetical protein